MINASPQFQAAIVGSPRRIEILAVVDISDPDLQWGAVTASSMATWSRIDEIHDKQFDAPVRYATLEENRWLLDGSFALFPEDYAVDAVGFAANELSGADGSFSNPQWVEQSISNVDVLQACSVFFSSDPADGVPVDFTVEILQNGTAYHTAVFSGNAATRIALDGFTVYTPDAIRVTVTKWSLPGRRVRIMDILVGIYEDWGGGVLSSFTAVQQAAFSCLNLPYGSVTLQMDNASRRFEPRRKNGLFQSIEERQGIQVYIGVRTAAGTVERQCLGVFYQAGDGWKTGDNSLTMQWDLVDIIGLISDRTFLLPDVLPMTLDGWISSVVAQLGEKFEGLYHVDPNYSGAEVVANSAAAVTGKKCGDIIRWACMAAGCWPRADAETGFLCVEPLWDQGNKLTLDNLLNYPVMKANESLAALIFKLADANETELVISGNATSSEKTVTISNPFIHTAEQARTAARLILSCYGGNVIETTGRGDPSSEIGDVDTIWLDESQATAARRMYQTFRFQGGVLQGCESRLLQADGSYLFTEFAVLTESGSWAAPAGVGQLFVAIGQGGQGSTAGENGQVIYERMFDDPVSVQCADGNVGLGGKVWYGLININPEQTFSVQIGQGSQAGAFGDVVPEGGETVFGAYTSADGSYYPNGYTDLRNGNSYGRTGVAHPVDGSSDGGKAGAGGLNEVWRYSHTEITYDEDGKPNGSYSVFNKISERSDGALGVDGANGFVLLAWDKVQDS